MSQFKTTTVRNTVQPVSSRPGVICVKQLGTCHNLGMFALIAHTQQTEQLAAQGYIAYGAGDFDGQNSGHDYYGVSSALTSSSVLALDS